MGNIVKLFSGCFRDFSSKNKIALIYLRIFFILETGDKRNWNLTLLNAACVKAYY